MKLPVRFSLFAVLLAALLVVSACNNGPKPIAVTITSPTGAQALDLGQSFNISVNVANDKLSKGATFSLSGVGALSNQTATGATYTAPTTGSGGTATITVASASDPTKTTTLTITVTAPPSITTSSFSAATEGTAYSGTVAVSGGAGSLTYSVSVGSLPAGLTLNSSTGAITGTATGPNGSVSFTIQVKDSSTVSPQTTTKALSITVNLPPPPTITTTSLPAGVEGTAYAQTVAATGFGTLAYSISAGTLPAGLALSSSTGTITGTPTGPNGTASFTVQVTDHSNPVQTATQALTITINLPAPPTISTTSLPGAVEFAAYNQTVAATGYAPLTYAITAGSLPAGLSINSSTGAITGSPTGPNGTASFTVQVTDHSNPAQTTTQALTIAVSLPSAPVITTTSLPNAIVGGNYSQTLVLTGGHAPFTWSISVGTLPSSLGINASTGVISGTVGSTTGTSNFTVQVVDSSNPAQTATQSLSITVVTAPLSVTQSSLPTGAINDVYPATNLGASGGLPPYTWSITTAPLPTGVSLNGNTISGIPTVSGTFPITFTVTDAASGTASSTGLSIVLASAPPLTVTTTSGSLPTGTLNTAYPSTYLNASGGIQPYTWSITSGALPTGLSLVSSGNNAGQITGTPTATGTFPFTVQVADSATPTANTATASLTITVSATSTTCDTTLTGQESLLHGDYAFVLSGFDSTGNPAFVGGVFVASGAAGAGNITAGSVDMNLIGGVQSLSLTTASTYNLGQDSTGGYRGCMALTTTAGTQHYAFSVDAIGALTSGEASDGHMIDFDSTGPFTAGILRQATSSAFSTNSITGNWAFGISGPKPLPPNSSGGKFAAAGVLTLSSGSVSGVADSNENGYTDNNKTTQGTPFPTSAAGITLGAGPYSIATNGRGTMTFYVGAGTSNPVDSFIYVVSASEVLVMGSDSQTNNNSWIGRALKQSGTFSNSSLTGNHVIYASGVSGTTGGSRVELDLVSTSGTTFNFSGYNNDAGSLGDPTTNSGSGTFSVTSNGRVTLSCSACNNVPVFYLSSANTAFFLNSDNSVSSGSFEPQTGSPFGNSSVSGNYGIGTIYPEVSGVSVQSGDVNFTSSTTSIAGTFDENAQGTLTPDNPGSETYSMGSTGVGFLPSGCSFTGGTCDTLLVVISPSKAVAVDAKPASGTNHITPSISVLQH